MRALPAVVSAALLVGCAVTIPEGVFECTGPEQCPSGWACVDERCVRSGRDAGLDARPDDAGSSDAAIDAPAFDAGVDAASDGGTVGDDGGSIDGGSIDGGSMDDAGSTDGGGSMDDAGSTDAGRDARVDAAAPDAAPIDGGATCSWPDGLGGCDDPVEIAPGGNFTCARRASGAVLCWGLNDETQLGSTIPGPVYAPGIVPVLPGPADEICAGGLHACARIGDTVTCWGANTRGQIGSGSAAMATLAPTTVVSGGAPLTGVLHIACGHEVTCARRVGDTAVCWGANDLGQLGDGTTTDRAEAVAVASLTDVAQLSVGVNHACARLGSGQLRCWGLNSSGQLGDGSFVTPSSPVVVQASAGVPLADALLVDATEVSTCALRASGRVSCWGGNEYGQLGNGTTTTSPRPVLVLDEITGAPLEGASDMTASAAGCAILAGGAVSCWGLGGHVGDGSSDATPRTRAVATVTSSGPFTGATSIAALRNHVCAIAGNVYCWGAGFGGAIGDGGSSDRNVATPVLLP